MSHASAEGMADVTLVVGTTAGGTGTHVAMLAAGFAARGMPVTVVGPPATGARLRLGSVPGVGFTLVEFGDRPRPRDAIALLRLRRALLSAGDSSRRRSFGVRRAARDVSAGSPDVVHAHGMRAGALAVLALGRFPLRGRRRPRLLVTVHNAPPVGGGAPALVYRLLERLVAGGADLVLCVSSDLETRMRAAGAREIARAVVPAPAPAASGPVAPSPPGASGPPPIPSCDRPLVLAVGRLVAQKGFDTLLEAAATWRDMEPRPLLMIAGDGPLAAGLRAKAAALGVDAAFPGQRDDVPALLAAAAVFVLPSRWEGQPLVLQEALRAQAPIVASRAGGIPDLTGEAAALLVPPGDPGPLATAVRSVLTDPALAARLRAAARSRAAALPSQDDAVAAALAAYGQALR
jgi:glycosyltransferase involved in cell wall biosynthesis